MRVLGLRMNAESHVGAQRAASRLYLLRRRQALTAGRGQIPVGPHETCHRRKQEAKQR